MGMLEEDTVGRAVGSTAGRRSAVPPRAVIALSPTFHRSSIPTFQFEVMDKRREERTC